MIFSIDSMDPAASAATARPSGANCRTTSTHSSFSTLIPLAPASFSASASRSSSMPVKQTLAPRLAMVCAVHWATGPSPITSAESPCSRFEARVPQLTPTWANSRPLKATGRGDGGSFQTQSRWHTEGEMCPPKSKYMPSTLPKFL